MSTDFYDRITIEHDYSTRNFGGSGRVKIDRGTMESGDLAHIEFEHFLETAAFVRWYFMGDPPSPQSEARWKRLLENATRPWENDRESYQEAKNHKVESPVAWEDLVREGIVPEPTEEEADE
jgi:hypothetical protein